MSKAIAPLAFGTKTALASQASQSDRIICAVRVLVKGENLRQKNQERGQCMPRGRVKFFNYAKNFCYGLWADAGSAKSLHFGDVGHVSDGKVGRRGHQVD